MNLRKFIENQKEFSERTFGKGKRTKGVCDHIRKELNEIEADPDDIFEWVDVIILSLDGAWRSGATPEEICDAIEKKLAINKKRQWPKPTDEDSAIEHIK